MRDFKIMNNMEEIWKDVVGYEGLYQVSNKGNVCNTKTHRILKQKQTQFGYLRVGLWDGHVQKQKFVHVLVAKAFIPNPNNYPQVNHKNENKVDNNVENLEWCTAKYNVNYGTCIKRRIEKTKGSKRPCITGDKHPQFGVKHDDEYKVKNMLSQQTRKEVCQYDLEGNLINIFNSIGEASRKTKTNRARIRLCLIGEAITANNSKWDYAI